MHSICSSERQQLYTEHTVTATRHKVATMQSSAIINYLCGPTQSSDFICGNKITSLMLFLLDKNMVMRSIPKPRPPVGGNPYSNAVTNASSIPCASSSPWADAFDCCSK